MAKKKLESIYIRGICIECNINPQDCKGTFKNKKIYRALCPSCHRNKYRTKYKYRKYKKNHCEKCGFIPEHPCQLDVDHIDGNKNNTKENNFQTLCANCHRLKTYSNKDWLNNEYKKGDI